MRRVCAGIILALMAAFSLAIYQNCSQAVEGRNQSSLSFQEFALDSKADSIAYMSCSDMGSEVNTDAYFTLRVGAYERGGMRLSDVFYQVTSAMSTEQAMRIFIDGEKNNNLQMQMAIRRREDMLVFSKENPAELNRDFVSVMAPVNTEKMVQALVDLEDGERLRRFSIGTGQENPNFSDRFEGSLNFMDSRLLEDAIRQELTNNALITFTYNPLGVSTLESDTEALGPSDFLETNTSTSSNSVFGTGYQVGFEQGLRATGHPRRVLSAVKEFNLENQSSTSNEWSCPQKLRLKIVRPEDVGVIEDGAPIVACNRLPDPSVLSKEEEIVRRVLGPNEWWLDMANGCVIPKSNELGFCYGESLDVEYGATECGGVKACAHFVSICTSDI